MLSVVVLICLTTVNTWAQETKEDVVYLENGSVIRGQVMEYDPNGNIKIERLKYFVTRLWILFA